MNADRSYQLVIHQPPASYFLKQAAGISRGAMEPGKLKWVISIECFVLYQDMTGSV